MRGLIAKLIVACTFVTSFPAFADVVESAQCERAGITRVVELRVETPAGIPCSVVYLRSEEGLPEESLWNARNDAQYCKTNYQNFLIKLKNKYNWICSSSNIVASVQSLAAGSELPSIEKNKPQLNQKPGATEALPVGQSNPPSLEPEIKPALPVIRNNAPLTKSVELYNSQIGFNLKTIQEFIPNARYNADAFLPHDGDVNSCPEEGYFVWNNRNPDKPVFEMGKELEFAVDLDRLGSGNNVGEIVDVVNNSSQNCAAQIEYSACQQPELKLGAALWNTNERSFSCAESPTNAATRAVALFQNRTLKPAKAGSCTQQPRIVHMALAPLGQNSAEQSVRQVNGLELIIVQAADPKSPSSTKRRTRCSYTRS